MDSAHIAALLSPFLTAALTDAQLAAISAYLDLLLRWNNRMNLTAVRDPKHIVTRHIGESLFAARRLLLPSADLSAVDVGSGAGFPGLPLKIYAPGLHLYLIESQFKKVAFLKEVIRALGLADVDVFSGRAEDFPDRADLVTMRAVERFPTILPVAASLLDNNVSSGQAVPRLALLIGASQQEQAAQLLPHFCWEAPAPVPLASSRILLVGSPQH